MIRIKLKYFLAWLVWQYQIVRSNIANGRPLRENTVGGPGMNVGGWIYIIIMFVVLFAVLVALYPTLKSGASSFGNQTGTIGVVVVTLLPILLAVGILLLFVKHFLPGKASGPK